MSQAAQRGSRLFSIGAFAVILEHTRVLLCHRRDMDAWDLPGGGVESRELPTEAVLREVQEETGLQVVVERLVGVYGRAEKDAFVFVFLCRVTGGQLAITDEADALQYFPVGRLPVNINPRQVERVQDALHPEAGPVFRRQSGVSTREWLAGLHI